MARKKDHTPTIGFHDERLVHVAGQGLPPIPGLDTLNDGGMHRQGDRTISSTELARLTPDELRRALERGNRLPQTFSMPLRIGTIAVENQ